MISLATIVMIAVWIGVAILAALVAVCWRNPVEGLKELQHLPEHLPEVMLGRYIAFLLMGIAFAVQGNLTAIAIFIFGLGFMAFHDARTYRTASQPFARHVAAGCAAAVIFGVTIFALFSNGAA